MSMQPQLRPIIRQNNAADLQDPDFLAAKDTYRRTREFLNSNARFIQYQKVLGFGSSGTATLWTELDQYGRPVQDIAVKAPRDINDDYFRMEIQWMDEFYTAEHFVHWVTLDSLRNGIQKKIATANCGRPDYMAPEQRDRVRPLEENALGPHTNIWNVGLLMFNALTLYHTDDEDWEPRVCPITMPDGEAKDLNTWAPFLVGANDMVYDQFKVYSIELRTLIARCMADDRRDRPSLHELLDTIERNIAAGDRAAYEARDEEKAPVDVKVPPAVEDDDLLRRFFQEYLREPPNRQDPYRNYWPRIEPAVLPPGLPPGWFPPGAFPPGGYPPGGPGP
ncbi:hypothetical protein F5B20DRAFT_589492 [Whalleya microplaca]|nr:hypothetical protein F5B20DRAFT_589492 [Whalleya microplaca]